MIKRISLAALAVALVVGTAKPSIAASSTTQPTANIGSGQKLKAALAQLDLSIDQKAQIKQIFAEFKAKEKGSTGSTTTAASGKALLKKVIAVLTPPQKTKLKEILKAAKTAKG